MLIVHDPLFQFGGCAGVSLGAHESDSLNDIFPIRGAEEEALRVDFNILR